eukprot:gnl/TRDRNA2_/TRDRNA2_150499_c0_seq1.p1 gnl/TRDRNA2_/TRDRNA2_150499_c0~~gnl/TRDRNA2_/TRDRNA2_150499_c0_seq1.p1  ORF type:complete len:127 (-),score=10.81 gnl/TRDRNA2_/TRDRNA2_150499_c0_seq1:292-672(-)
MDPFLLEGTEEDEKKVIVERQGCTCWVTDNPRSWHGRHVGGGRYVGPLACPSYHEMIVTSPGTFEAISGYEGECDGCGQSITNDIRWRCLICDYDFCERCRQDLESNALREHQRVYGGSSGDRGPE